MSRSAMHDRGCVAGCVLHICALCRKACVMQGVPACCRGHAGYQRGHGLCAAETPGCRGCIPSRGEPPHQPAGRTTLSSAGDPACRCTAEKEIQWPQHCALR